MTSVSNGIAARFLMAAAAVALAAGGALAQDAGTDAPPTGAIATPSNPQFFATDNPNLRKATVVVNGEIVTGTDVDQRVALIIAASQGKIAPEEVQRLKLQVLRNLMDETLQIQEAKAQKIEVENKDVEQTYARVAQQNFGQNSKAMDSYLIRIGSSPASLKRQIKGELAWQRLLQRNVNPFVNVSDEEVKEVMDRLQAAKGTEEYHVAEIFLAATDENKAQVQQNAAKIVEELKKGGNFQGYARQYSESSSASVGGDLGWLRLGQLPAELDTVLGQLQVGQLAGPVPIRGGFSILAMIDKRKVLTADPRDAVLSLKQISIALPAGTPQAEAQKRAQVLATAIQGARGCANVDAVAKGVGAEVVTNDQLKARDLPPALQQSLLSLTPGQTTPPFGSAEEGIRILMLCGRDDPQIAGGPSFEQIQSQIEEDRTNKRAQAYLRDLRRDAVIDYGT